MTGKNKSSLLVGHLHFLTKKSPKKMQKSCQADAQRQGDTNTLTDLYLNFWLFKSYKRLQNAAFFKTNFFKTPSSALPALLHFQDTTPLLPLYPMEEISWRLPADPG